MNTYLSRYEYRNRDEVYEDIVDNHQGEVIAWALDDPEPFVRAAFAEWRNRERHEVDKEIDAFVNRMIDHAEKSGWITYGEPHDDGSDAAYETWTAKKLMREGA